MPILINDNTARVQYTATSGQTTFAVPFEFFENSDLKVYRNSTLQTITTHYTLTGAGVTGGGNLTFVSGVTLNDIITIVRDIPIQRVTDFPLSGPFNITALNLQLDQLTAMIQEVNTLVTTRVPLLAEFDQPSAFSALPTQANRANNYFVFDANGNPAVASSALAVIDFIAAGAGAVTRSVENKLRDVVSVKDFGAVGNGVANDAPAFSLAAAASQTVTVPAGTYLLNSSPSAATYIVSEGATFTGSGKLNVVSGHVLSNVGAYRNIESDASFYNGIFGYLEQNAALTGYGTIGLHGSARSAGGTGTAAEADIGVAGFAAHDLAASNGGVWALYGTAVRQAGVNGATHPLELDIANMGSTVQLFPHAMFPSGATPCAWICTGGEVTAAGGSPGIASCAIGIVQNDSQAVKTAKYDKGIVFHNTAINGADGATGIGTAIAFAVGHATQWYNNSAQVIGEIVATGVTQANNNYRLDFSDSGLLVQDRATGVTAVAVAKVASATNGIQINPAVTTANPTIAAIGSDTNIDLQLTPKGTGLVKFGTLTANADASITGYVSIRTAAGATVKLAVIA